MWPSPQILQLPQFLHLPTTPPVLQRRRHLATNSLLLLFFANTQQHSSSHHATAQSNSSQQNQDRGTFDSTNTTTPTDEQNKVFLDISIDDNPAGKIIIALHGGLGASRFSDLVSGVAGLSYKRRDFTKIMPNFVQHGGVGGLDIGGAEKLVEEWERSERKNTAGAVSIIVRDPSALAPKVKLVAERGRLEFKEELMTSAPNGTEFVIAARDSPELDSCTLVIGRVLEGMEVVERIRQLNTVPDNSASPVFRFAKLIGDKRALIAERGFNRPFSKVRVTDCGIIK